MLRAIYIGDARYDQANVFEFNAETGRFEMITDPEFGYTIDLVMNDPDWIVVVVNKDEEFYQIENKNRVLE